MKWSEINDELGIKGIRKVSEHTVTVVKDEKTCWPASNLERKMYKLLKELSEDDPD